MAHSILIYNNRHDIMRDSDIFLLIGLLRAHINVDQPDVRMILDNYFFGYDGMPSGGIDLDLDVVLAEPSIAQMMRSSLNSAIATIESFGETVPSDWLSHVLDDGTHATYKDRSKLEILDKLERFRKVIASS